MAKRATTAAITAVAIALATAPSAFAAPKSIAGFVGDAAGVNTGGLFTAPTDVAVYTGADADFANDKIFVTEALSSNSSRVQRLDAHGNFERMWGQDVIRGGAPGDTGTGFEICTEAVSGAENCKAAPPGMEDGELSNPQGIAVNQSTGHVYVVDRDNHRIQEFDLDGNFIRAWGSQGSDPGQFEFSSADGVGVAVDPVNGDVFVADPGNARVQQFSSSGAFVAGFGAPGSDPGQFAAGQPLRLAVDSNHVVYISDSNDSDRIQRYDSAADAFLTPIACCAPAPGAPLVEGATVGLEIDPDSDGAGIDEEHLLVAREPASGPVIVQELDLPTVSSDPVTAVVDTHTFEDEMVTGIGFRSTTGDLYLFTPGLFVPPFTGSPTNCLPSEACAGLFVMTPTSVAPSAVMGAPDAEATSATLDGTVNAGGGVARYRFQVSSDGVNWTDVGGGYVSGLEDVAVSTEARGLEPNTAYQARILITKQTGIDTAQSDTTPTQAFMTDQAPPDVETLGSTLRTDRSARLRANVDPNGLETTYRFEYGLAGGPLDRHVPDPDGSAGAGSSPRPVFADIAGLEPETSYEYRIVATNAVGTSTGEVVGFTTEASAGAARAPLGRGYELVSPGDKVGGVGVGIWYNGPASVAHVGVGAHERERFALQGALGSVLVDGPFAYSNDWALAERTPAGWVSAPGISRRAHGTQAKADITMSAAADDLSLSSWKSGGHTLKLFPEMETWGANAIVNVLFLRDWTEGRWEIFGPTREDQVVNGAPIAEGGNAIAADGSAAVATGSGTRGLAGPGDPTAPGSPDLVDGASSVYLHDVSDGLTDTYPGANEIRTLVNLCSEGTEIPARIDAGGDRFEQAAVDCPAGRLIDNRGATLGPDTDGVISADGSRVFFMSPDIGLDVGPCTGTDAESVCPSQLYVWQRDSDGGATTRWISQSEVPGQEASLMGQARFEGASRDGDKVFFRSNSPLTADDPNGAAAPPAGGVTSGDAHAESWDLFMYDLPDAPGADPADGELVRLSAGPDGNGDCNVRPGALRFVSDDGSKAYFTCSAPLEGLPVTGSGTTTAAGGSRSSADASNLYLHDATRPAAQRWRFVARLPRTTSTLSLCATGSVAPGSVLTAAFDDQVSVAGTTSCVNGTADGSLVTFFTDGQLTGDDPDAVSGDVYGYDADQDELSRLSAPRNGAGVQPYPCAPPDGAVLCFGDGGIGQAVAPLQRLGVATRPDGDHLAFFESRSRLLPQDTDNAYDVYQWRAATGDLSLLSTGTSSTDGAMFVGNDRSGLNVYLATRDRLTWQDFDSVLDVYTARIGGGIPQPPPPADCTVLVDRCQPPGAPPGQSRIESKKPTAGNARPRARIRLSLSGLSRQARRRAARTGVVRVRVRVSRPARVTVTAHARIGGKTRRVALARKRARRAGTVTVKLRLNRLARRRLASGRALRLRIVADTQRSAARQINVTLKRGNR